MTGNRRELAQQSPPEKAGCLSGILRITWMAFGNVALFFCAMAAARRAAPSALDGAYAALVIALIVVRYVDIARFGGQTSDGDPATLAHWRRYALGLVVVAVAVRALMHVAHANGFL